VAQIKHLSHIPAVQNAQQDSKPCGAFGVSLLVAVLLIGSIGSAAARAAPTGDRRVGCEARWRGLPAADPARAAGHGSFMQRCLADCPDRRKDEPGKAYGGRTGDYCEVRWSSQLAARQTGGQTHDEFVDTCLRRCVARQAGAPLGWILGGVGAAALGGAAAGAGGGHSTPPPASP
jgi:hypothetical protein